MAPGHPEYKQGVRQWLDIGTVIEHTQAFRLVQMGAAKPADDECEKAASMSAGQKAAAQQAYKRLEAGIHPEDFEAFDAGHMVGYKPDGSWISGPNYIEDEE